MDGNERGAMGTLMFFKICQKIKLMMILIIMPAIIIEFPVPG